MIQVVYMDRSIGVIQKCSLTPEGGTVTLGQKEAIRGMMRILSGPDTKSTMLAKAIQNVPSRNKHDVGRDKAHCFPN